MSKLENKLILHESVIASKIFTIRDENVILDVHLAELYEVETRALKQAVRRNRERFPTDFMYELTNAEIEEVVSQNVIPSKNILEALSLMLLQRMVLQCFLVFSIVKKQ